MQAGEEAEREKLKQTPRQAGSPVQAWSHNPEITTKAETKTLNLLSHPGASTMQYLDYTYEAALFYSTT